MEITVNIPDELAAQVQARGFALEEYIRELMKEKLSTEGGTEAQRWKAVQRMLEFAEKHRFLSGGQGPKHLVHEGHKY